MALTSGTRLGPYEIESPLGAGGMGEVYRARDTRLERTVAIKVLNAELVASTELRARFEREAKVISQLQHPNICVLHDVGNEGPVDYLVMEFLQGESLAERLRKGPLPPEQVLTIATDQQLMAVDIQQNGASLQLGAPHALFKANTVVGSVGTYTASADGKKFVMNTVPPQTMSEPLTLITNWPADLNRR